MRHTILPALRWIGMAAVLFAAHASADRPQTPRDGQIHHSESAYEVWDERADAWVNPERFWLSYAQRAGGKYWGRSDTYPPYRQVREHDTLLIDVDQGPCLMYFFHSRWRRAQDVRRWDPEFNNILGCPSVFN